MAAFYTEWFIHGSYATYTTKLLTVNNFQMYKIQSQINAHVKYYILPD